MPSTLTIYDEGEEIVWNMRKHIGSTQAPFSTIYLEIEEGHPYEEDMALICEEMIKQRVEGMKNYRGQEIGEACPKLVYLLDEHNC